MQFALYELLIAWREVGKVPQIDLLEFRHKLGIESDEYIRMSEFQDSCSRTINQTD